MAYKNPKDAKRYRKLWYAANRKKHIARCVQNERIRRDKIRAALAAYLQEHPCVDCNEQDIVVLDFDHVRGKKVANIADMIVHNGCSLAKIMREVAKCDVVCSNDHRRRTAKRGGHYRYQVSILR